MPLVWLVRLPQLAVRPGERPWRDAGRLVRRRNRPSGYGNAGIAYRIFAHSAPLEAAKQVEFVVLPSNGNIHVFDMAIAP